MTLQACQNCWFNGLQYGPLGLPVGYCIKHERVLNFADGTTCRMHIRKDLGLARATEVSKIHSRMFPSNRIVRWMDKSEVATDTSSSPADVNVLESDDVGNSVCSYGYLNSTIESLAQLEAMRTVRADVALTSLARAYVRNCVSTGGDWTSGIHLYWWIQRRLAIEPELAVTDIRFVGSSNLSRQTELTSWSVMMFRLSFVDDFVHYAGQAGDDVGRAAGLLDLAATDVTTFNTGKLSQWMKAKAIPLLNARLDKRRYSSIAQTLHKKALSPSGSQ